MSAALLFTFVPLPEPPVLNERQLAAQVRERITDLVDGTLTFSLAMPAIPETVELYQNGAKLDEGAAYVSYSVGVDGQTITLTDAALAVDIYIAQYIARAGG